MKQVVVLFLVCVSAAPVPPVLVFVPPRGTLETTEVMSAVFDVAIVPFRTFVIPEIADVVGLNLSTFVGPRIIERTFVLVPFSLSK